LKINLTKYDAEIENVEPIYGPQRSGDIPHSLASIEKGKAVLNYNPQIDAKKGFELVAEWYYNNIK
jgi:UDP-N-acetylglucosamine 4-epimerase